MTLDQESTHANLIAWCLRVFGKVAICLHGWSCNDYSRVSYLEDWSWNGAAPAEGGDDG